MIFDSSFSTNFKILSSLCLQVIFVSSVILLCLNPFAAAMRHKLSSSLPVSFWASLHAQLGHGLIGMLDLRRKDAFAPYTHSITGIPCELL
jgi:hypothetical protein